MYQFSIEPIGKVINKFNDSWSIPDTGGHSIIELFPHYLSGLEEIEQYSHLWIMGWYNQSNREILQSHPKLNPSSKPFGVFALRSSNRPNPISLSLVKLLKTEKNHLHVENLDLINETRIIDIKPYIENDMIFCPKTPFIRSIDQQLNRKRLLTLASQYHDHDCFWLEVGVRIAMLIEDNLGQITNPKLSIILHCPQCLGDILQGITCSHIGGNHQISFVNQSDIVYVHASLEGKTITLRLKEGFNSQNITSDLINQDIFQISVI